MYGAKVWSHWAIRLLHSLVYPKHCPQVIEPQHGDEPSASPQALAVTPARRWTALRPTEGIGPIYEDRCKSYPIQQDAHCFMGCRLVRRKFTKNQVGGQRDRMALDEFVGT